MAHGAVGVLRACNGLHHLPHCWLAPASPRVAPSLWLLQPCDSIASLAMQSAWLMAPSVCSVHTMACITYHTAGLLRRAHVWCRRFGSCIRWLCTSCHVASLAHGAVGVLCAHDGLHHLPHCWLAPASPRLCGAVALALAFDGFASLAMQPALLMLSSVLALPDPVHTKHEDLLASLPSLCLLCLILRQRLPSLPARALARPTYVSTSAFFARFHPRNLLWRCRCTFCLHGGAYSYSLFSSRSPLVGGGSPPSTMFSSGYLLAFVLDLPMSARALNEQVLSQLLLSTLPI